jgi:hypothetical protein
MGAEQPTAHFSLEATSSMMDEGTEGSRLFEITLSSYLGHHSLERR